MAIWCLASYYIQYFHEYVKISKGSYKQEHVYKLFDDTTMQVIPELVTEDKLIDMLCDKDNYPSNVYIKNTRSYKRVHISGRERLRGYVEHVTYSSYIDTKSRQEKELHELKELRTVHPVPNAFIDCTDEANMELVLYKLYNLNNRSNKGYTLDKGAICFPCADHLTKGNNRKICIGVCSDSIICVDASGKICAYNREELNQPHSDDRYNIENIARTNGRITQNWRNTEVPDKYRTFPEIPYNKLSKKVQKDIDKVAKDMAVANITDRGWFIDKYGRICVDANKDVVSIYIQNHPYKLLSVVPINSDTDNETVWNIGDFVVCSGPVKIAQLYIRAKGKVKLPDTIRELGSKGMTILGTNKLDLSNTKLSLMKGKISTSAQELILPSTATFANVKDSARGQLSIPNVKDFIVPDDMVILPLKGLIGSNLERLVLPMRPMDIDYYAGLYFEYDHLAAHCINLKEIWASLENKEVAECIIGGINSATIRRGAEPVKLVLVKKKE